MNKVILKQSGELVDHRGEVVVDALRVLADRLALDQGFTLRGFTRLLIRHPDLQRLSGFAPSLAALSTAAPGDGIGPEALEFSRVVEIIGAPGPARLEVYHILRGRIGGSGDEEIRGWQVESLLDVPVRLGELRHVVFGDTVSSFHFETVCALFDFIDGVIWQLAFHGAPQECALRR